MIAQIKKSKKQTVKQQKIVNAAITLFAEKGYSNTSTSEIAKFAEVSEGTIFKHYGTKENLLLSIIVPFIKENAPTMAGEVLKQTLTENTTTFEQFLRNFLKNRLNFISENKEIFQIFFKEIIYQEELKNEISSLFYEIAILRLSKAIEVFQERGDLIESSSDKVAKMLFTVLGGFIVSNFVLMNKEDVGDKEIEEVISFVMNGIRKPK